MGNNSSFVSFPGDPVVKNLSVNAGDSGLIPEWGRSAGGGTGNPPGKSHGQRSLMGYTVHGVAKSWTWLSMRRHAMQDRKLSVTVVVPKSVLSQADISDQWVEKEEENQPQQSSNNIKPRAERTSLVLGADITVSQPGGGWEYLVGSVRENNWKIRSLVSTLFPFLRWLTPFCVFEINYKNRLNKQNKTRKSQQVEKRRL